MFAHVCNCLQTTSPTSRRLLQTTIGDGLAFVSLSSAGSKHFTPASERFCKLFFRRSSRLNRG
jgi:hypothetical protein